MSFATYDAFDIVADDVLSEAEYIWKQGAIKRMYCNAKTWKRLKGHRGRSQSHIRKLEKAIHTDVDKLSTLV